MSVDSAIEMARPRAAAAGTTGAEETSARWLVVLFVLSLLPPIFFSFLGMRLTLTRILLLVGFIPFTLRLLSGKAGPLRGIDLFMALFSVWIAVTYSYHYGTGRIALSGITVVEFFGAYLLGRTMVRNTGDYRAFLNCFLLVMLCLFPFTLLELFTDRNLLQEAFRGVVGTYSKAQSSYGRMGMNRVMSGFEHPILYGLFCASGVATFFTLMANRALGLLLALFASFMAFASLSSAPFLAASIQIGMLAWGWISRERWVLLTSLTALCYVTVDLLSNRTPITILINYITFDPGTAWTRVNVWKYGSQNMWSHPIFGLGLDDWARPSWLTGSVDNFWLVMGMRHGVVGVLLLMIALALGLWTIVRNRGLDPETARLRTGYVITLVGIYFTLVTVHIWGDTSSFVAFFIGAGMWFADARPAAAPVAAVETPPPISPYTRQQTLRQRAGSPPPRPR